MNDAWARDMSRVLARARERVPTAQALVPKVQEIAQRNASAAAGRGASARVAVHVSGNKVIVQATGRGSAQFLRDTRESLRRNHAQLVALVQEQARQGLRGR